MTDWVRLWHDMPTDPKWRVVARKSGQPLPCVLAVFTMMLTNASCNAADRGTLLAWDHEDAAAALDMDPEQIEAIFDAMQGKVLEGQRLTGWERRQPKREDNSAQRVAKHRAEKKRDVTQGNAPETDTEEETEVPPSAPRKRRAEGKTMLPEDWAAPPVTALSPKARACAEQWTSASYETVAEAFAMYWRRERKPTADWHAAWCGWIIREHAKVMRDQKFGQAAPQANGSTRRPMNIEELRAAIRFAEDNGDPERAADLKAQLAKLRERPPDPAVAALVARASSRLAQGTRQ